MGPEHGLRLPAPILSSTHPALAPDTPEAGTPGSAPLMLSQVPSEMAALALMHAEFGDLPAAVKIRALLWLAEQFLGLPAPAKRLSEVAERAVVESAGAWSNEQRTHQRGHKPQN